MKYSHCKQCGGACHITFDRLSSTAYCCRKKNTKHFPVITWCLQRLETCLPRVVDVNFFLSLFLSKFAIVQNNKFYFRHRKKTQTNQSERVNSYKIRHDCSFCFLIRSYNSYFICGNLGEIKTYNSLGKREYSTILEVFFLFSLGRKKGKYNSDNVYYSF